MSAKLKWNVHPRLQIELDATSIKDAFEQMSAYSVLAETKCGLCESVRVYPRHRVSKGFSFYEMSCPDCKAVFSFGQHKDMDTLFPKEREGWHRFVPGDGEGSSSSTDSTYGSRSDEDVF